MLINHSIFSEINRDFSAMRQLVIHLPNVNRVNREFCIIKTSQLPTFLSHSKKNKQDLSHF